MVELQSCGSLVNASAFSGMEEQTKRDHGNALLLAQISADLQSERRKNAELMQRISVLEARLQNKSNDGHARERGLKRQKMEPSGREKVEKASIFKTALNSNIAPAKDVNWLSMDDNQLFNFEKLKASEPTADWDDTDGTDDDNENLDENRINIRQKGRENIGDNVQPPDAIKYLPLGVDSSDEGKLILSHASQGSNEDTIKDSSAQDINPVYKAEELKTRDLGGYKYNVSPKVFTSRQELRGFGSISMQKNPPKMAFCPKEVKRIMESEELLLKNAQSHTIRKIIVFASLGIRHGCEDMYELDFNHFTILQKGKPYVSVKNPGEHVLYEKPGVRRKVFYPNRENPTLCPVQILEEEKAMRPPDSSCPSFLFLCIKYGGRTRNLPQNEYVRQRMGRNKLKSFGPLICRTAMLVNVRSGSFFFKAFGITLLFMAGFTDNLVQRETKYRNLDLLQKYYRTDEDTKDEALFHSQPMACGTTTIPNPKKLAGKTSSTKSKGRKNTSSNIKSHKASILKPSSENPTQFGLTGNATAVKTHAPNPAYCSPLISNPSQSSQQGDSFVPMMCFPPPPPPNGFFPCPYPSSYPFQYFHPAGNYIPIYPHPYYSHASFNTLIPKMVQVTGKNNTVSDESDSGSNRSSSDTESKEEKLCILPVK